MKIASAYLEITNICNLDCLSCYNSSGRPHARREMSISQIKAIADRLIGEFGCHYIMLAGGEPTLHSEFETVLHHLLSYPGLRVSIVTNGTIDAPYLIEAYAQHPDLKIQVSLDGSCEEINAKTRGTGHFAKAIDTLVKLSDSGKPPVMKMVISQNNIQDVGNYYRLAVSMNCDPDFDFINSLGKASEVWDSVAPTPQQKLSALWTLDRLNTEYKQNVHLPFCTSQCPLSVSETELSVLIKCDGKIQPCQLLYDDCYSLGNFLSDDTETIVEKRKKLTELAVEREHATIGCAKCLVRQTCKRGRMAFAVMKTVDPMADDGECTCRKFQLLGYEVVKQGVLS